MNTAMADCFDVLSRRLNSLGSSENQTTSVFEVENRERTESAVQHKTQNAEVIFVEAIKRREEHAFMELVERFHSPLLRVATTFVHCDV